MDELHLKKELLEKYLKELGSVAVAFSAGVDSTFLLKTAHDVLKENAIAITANSDMFPRGEFEQAVDFCKAEGIKQIITEHDEFSVEGFAQNPKNRCYLCKRKLFSEITKAAKENGIKYVLEGSNADDTHDYRPGMAAIKELGVKSPLLEVGLSKSEIRQCSKELGLSTWDKPSFACLASRFVYGEAITKEKLKMVSEAENFIKGLSLRQLRVRIHGNSARIEVPPEDFSVITKHAAEINDKLRELGFSYVSLDLGGYFTGSMNRTL